MPAEEGQTRLVKKKSSGRRQCQQPEPSSANAFSKPSCQKNVFK